MTKFDYSKSYIKALRKSPKNIKIAFRSRLALYLKDKYHPLLNNHALAGKYQGHRSINVTGDWRAIFREFDNGNTVYFDEIGTHSQLYR
jgi:addiction module RelE/StbE family toxin